MRAKAGVDEAVLHRLRIKHRQVAVRALGRKGLGRRVVRAFLAEGRIVRTAHPGGKPHPTMAVEHAVVIVRLAFPHHFVAPIGRRLHRFLTTPGVSESRTGRREILDRMGFGIQDRNDIDAQFGRTVNRTVGVNRRKAPIGGDQVVQVMLIIEPIPSRHDDVALGPLRPCRFRMGQLALGDAVRPVR